MERNGPPIKLGILGATGRMGREIGRLALALPEKWILSGAGVRQGHDTVGQDYGVVLGHGPLDVVLSSNPQEIFKASQVVVDFSAPQALDHHLQAFRDHPTPYVLGVTGFDDYDGTMAALKGHSSMAPILYGENTSLTLQLISKLIKHMAAFEPESYDVEILDIHHRHKKDAPSGTARHLAHCVAETRGISTPNICVHRQNPGPRPRDAIGIASLRGGHCPGTHQVHFMGPHDQMTLSYQSFDRRVYAQGALTACAWLYRQPPGFYTMAHVVG